MTDWGCQVHHATASKGILRCRCSLFSSSKIARPFGRYSYPTFMDFHPTARYPIEQRFGDKLHIRVEFRLVKHRLPI